MPAKLIGSVLLWFCVPAVALAFLAVSGAGTVIATAFFVVLLVAAVFMSSAVLISAAFCMAVLLVRGQKRMGQCQRVATACGKFGMVCFLLAAYALMMRHSGFAPTGMTPFGLMITAVPLISFVFSRTVPALDLYGRIDEVAKGLYARGDEIPDYWDPRA